MIPNAHSHILWNKVQPEQSVVDLDFQINYFNLGKKKKKKISTILFDISKAKKTQNCELSRSGI